MNEGKRVQEGEKTEQSAAQSSNTTLLEQAHFIPGQSSNETQATPSNDEDYFHDAELNPTNNNSSSAAMVNNDEYSLANTDLKDTVSGQTSQESIKPNFEIVTKNCQPKNSSSIENRISKNEIFKDALNKNRNLKLISHPITIVKSDSLNDSMVDSLESVNVQEEPLKRELVDSIEIIQYNKKETKNDQEIEEYESLEHVATDSIENFSSLEQLGNNSYIAKPNNKRNETCIPYTPKKLNENIFDETISVSLSDILFDSSIKKSANLEVKSLEPPSPDNITFVDMQNNIELGKADDKNAMHEGTFSPVKDTEQKIVVNTAKMQKDEKEIIPSDEVVNISIPPETQEKENQKRKCDQVDEHVKKPRIETIPSEAILESPSNEQINKPENVSLNNDDSNKELQKALKSGDTNVKSNTDEKNQEKLIMGIEKTLTKINEKQNDQEVKKEKIMQEKHESKVEDSKPVVKEKKDQNSVWIQNTNNGETKVIPECSKKIETEEADCEFASKNQNKGDLDNKSKINVNIAKEIAEDFKNVAPKAVKIKQDELVITRDTKMVLEQNCDIIFERQDTQEFEKLEKQFQETLRESDVNVNLPNNVPEIESLKLIPKEETNISNIQNLTPLTTELKQAETNDTETALEQNRNICYERQDTQEFEKLEKKFKENSDNIAQLKTEENDNYLVADKTSLLESVTDISELPKNTSELQYLKLVRKEMVDEKKDSLGSNISNIQNSASVATETKQEELIEVSDTEMILEPNSNLNFEKQETHDFENFEKQFKDNVDVSKPQTAKNLIDLVGENKPKPNNLHESDINVSKLAINLSENQNLKSDPEGKNKNIIVDVNKESLESKNSNIQILQSVPNEIKQNKLVEANDIEKIIEQTRDMAFERQDIQEYEKLENQFKENLENKNEIIDTKKESLEESCTSSTEILKDQKPIRETERRHNKECREQLKPIDETKNEPLIPDNKNSKNEIKTHINIVNYTSKDAETSSTESAVTIRELAQINISNKSDKDLDQTDKIIFERQDTREFEKLEKQCKEDVPSGSNFEPQKSSDNLEVNNDQTNNELKQMCEKVFENQNTGTFENLEKPCVGNVDTDDILDQLVTESNANNVHQQLELDINYQDINVEMQSNKAYDRQDTREFELIEKQCIENVENSDSVLKEKHVNYIPNKTDISAELAVDTKGEEQNTGLENKIEMETFYPPTEGKPKIPQKGSETKNTNFIRRDYCEGDNIIYDRQDTQEFENLERQCKGDIKKPNLKTDDILEQLVAESINDINAETKNLKISMEQEHKIVNTVYNTTEEIYDKFKQGEHLQRDEIVNKEIKPKQSLESENSAVVETGRIESISSVKDSICISTNSIEDSSNSIKTVICCTKQTCQNDINVDTNCEGASKSEETKDETTQNTLLTNESKKKDNKKNDTSNKSTRNFKKEEKLPKKVEVQPNIRNSNNKEKSCSSQEANESQNKDNNINELTCNAYENRNNELKNKVDKLQQELDSIKKLNRRKDHHILSSTPDKQANRDATLKYKNILKEYETYIMQQTKDLEKLKMESESNIRNFTNTEMAFSDVFEKYEKTKFVIAVYRKNEDILLENIQNAEEQLSQVETKCLSMKQQSVEQIKRAHEQMEQEKRQYKQEINKLQTQVKRLEIKASSLEVELKQKTDECQALAALCDDITGRN